MSAQPNEEESPMSAQPQRQAEAAEYVHPIRMRVKQRMDDDDRGTIFVLQNDPFQSITARIQNGAVVERRVAADRRAPEISARPERGPEFLKPSPTALRLATEACAAPASQQAPREKTSSA